MGTIYTHIVRVSHGYHLQNCIFYDVVVSNEEGIFEEFSIKSESEHELFSADLMENVQHLCTNPSDGVQRRDAHNEGVAL